MKSVPGNDIPRDRLAVCIYLTVVRPEKRIGLRIFPASSCVVVISLLCNVNVCSRLPSKGESRLIAGGAQLGISYVVILVPHPRIEDRAIAGLEHAFDRIGTKCT